MAGTATSLRLWHLGSPGPLYFDMQDLAALCQTAATQQQGRTGPLPGDSGKGE